ncbi:MAG: hypothetical protein WC615_13140 [Mucilaginibacter sp.]|jgi:hypothetical protein|uniref:hypothetical protein n=1 Tax=Mucilaginibacter sp. TaxID=1882438 RepID=UPI00356909A6
MFTKDFQLMLIFSSIAIIVLLGVYAIYCRQRAKSFVNTGRVTDIQIWATKSAVIWMVTFVLAFVMVAEFVLSEV